MSLIARVNRVKFRDIVPGVFINGLGHRIDQVPNKSSMGMLALVIDAGTFDGDSWVDGVIVLARDGTLREFSLDFIDVYDLTDVSSASGT